MFDIGFLEIIVIAVVALLVVGPDEFPALVRNISVWIGKVRKFMSETKDDLEREFTKAEELKRLIERETNLAALHEKIDARKIVSDMVMGKPAASSHAEVETETKAAPVMMPLSPQEPESPEPGPQEPTPQPIPATKITPSHGSKD